MDAILVQTMSQRRDDDQDWKVRLRHAVWSSFRLYKKYPGVASELNRTGFPGTDAGRRAARSMTDIFLNAGAPAEKVPALILTATAVIFGLEMELSEQDEREAKGDLSPEEKLNLDTRRGETLPKNPMNEETIEDAIEILILGVEHFIGKK